ncbi:unnamed protein product [marine sediment metagenome]|uniref:Uncharacterized protein n=1 Tax=marine sediment metagenome TaxID=412755 RepID=X1FVS7_9ZZZZ
MKQTTIRFWQLWRRIKGIFVRGRDASDYFIVNFEPDPEDFMRRLIPLGYQYNYFSYNFKDQICNVRKLVIETVASIPAYEHENEIWQYHLRLYDSGEVTGHFEKSYEENAMEHIRGVGLTEISEVEREKIIEALK